MLLDKSMMENGQFAPQLAPAGILKDVRDITEILQGQASLKNIEIMERENILEHVRAISPIFLERLHALRDLPMVGNTRGMGLVGCVEGTVDDSGDAAALKQAFGNKVDRKCEELGLIVRPLGHMCVFSPPLIITERQIDEMFAILEKAIRLVAAEF